MKTLLIILISLVILLLIGFGSLPFILASILKLSWINWFGILTIPSTLIGIIGITFQIKLFFDK